jgi:hypothetical protein
MSFLTRPRPRKPPPPQHRDGIGNMSDAPKVTAYFRRDDGAVEKVHLFNIDFAEARAREPHAWSLNAPPAGTKIVDLTSTEQGMPR